MGFRKQVYDNRANIETKIGMREKAKWVVNLTLQMSQIYNEAFQLYQIKW